MCVASGSPLAFQLFGRRSTCEVEGQSHVEVGDREPTHDPATAGTVEILGGPCPGGGCSVGAFFNLAMEPITFSVRFASDPTFSDLSATGNSRSDTPLVGLEATFAEDTVEGTGNGRRGSQGLAVNALNQSPLVLGIDWAGRACDLTGNLASTVDGENPDGTCEGDGTTLCTVDSPDCDAVGGPCVFEAEDIEDMTVTVALGRHAREPAADGRGGRRPDARVHLDRRGVVHAQRQREQRPRPGHRARELARGQPDRPRGGSEPDRGPVARRRRRRRATCCA